MGKTFSADLPWPPSILRPNGSHGHWRTKATAKKRYRRDCWAACHAMGVRPLQGPLNVTITFRPPNQRSRDDDNTIASFKAGRDGVAEAVRVDDGEWNVTYAHGESVKGGRVEIRLEEAGETKRAGAAATATRP